MTRTRALLALTAALIAAGGASALADDPNRAACHTHVGGYLFSGRKCTFSNVTLRPTVTGDVNLTEARIGGRVFVPADARVVRR